MRAVRFLIWIGVAIFIAVAKEPVPRWLVVLLCTLLALSEVVEWVNGRIVADTVRTKAITEAMRVLGRCADGHGEAGEHGKAIAVLDAAKTVGELTDKAEP